MREVRTKARRGQLSAFEFASPIYSLADFEERARDSYISYLKSSGERIGDLVSMSDDDLRKWYQLVKKQNDQEREAIEKRRMQQDAQRRRRR